MPGDDDLKIKYRKQADHRQWRKEQLILHGVHPSTAQLLANTHEDLHKMLDSIDAGCPENQLIDIFGPDFTSADLPADPDYPAELDDPVRQRKPR